jgi:prepilin-type N-terminal cleavage/methylation domain-containing protein
MRNLWASLRRTDQRGYSLVELMFVVGIAGIAIASIVRFSFRSRIALSRQEVATDLYNTNARIGSNLREDLQSAYLMLANYNGAHSMTALMQVVRASTTAGGAPPPVAFTMPAVVSSMNDPDLTGTAATTWGNELMYVAQLAPITFTVQDGAYGGCTCTSSSLAVERFQVVYDYLTNSKTATIPDLGPSLRMVQWRSAPILDWRSVDLTNSGRTSMSFNEACGTVMAMGYNLALDPDNTQALTTAFYTVVSPTTAGNPYTVTSVSFTVATLPQSSWAFMDDYDALQSFNARPNVNKGRVSNSGTFGSISAPYTKSIAYNNTGAGSPKVNGLDAPGKMLSVPLYAQADLSVPGFGGGAGFPAGFEVAIMGPSEQRQIYMRRVIMSSSATKPGGPAKTYMAHEATDEVTIQNNGY